MQLTKGLLAYATELVQTTGLLFEYLRKHNMEVM